uniref:Uncharacterized protein n=1 Tax=Arundo donax TaxID=35708 RepID=A0A0A9EHK3_ARUDO
MARQELKHEEAKGHSNARESISPGDQRTARVLQCNPQDRCYP